MTTLYDNVLAGQISDNPLSSGATTINSAAFANMSTVSGSDIMWITLDPDAVDGAPEIVKVTAHTAAATSVTVTRAQQGTTARAHNQNTVWKHAVTASDLDVFLTTVVTANIVDSNVTTAKIADANVTLAKLAAAVSDRLPQAGDLKWTLDTAESGAWVNHNQTLVGAQSAFPALWAVAPTSWKSGSDLTIPDLSDVAMIGAGTVAALGALGGANTATLTTAELPAHTHTGPSHTHTGPSHTHTTPAHSHTASSGTTGSHGHTITSSSDAAGTHSHGVTGYNADGGVASGGGKTALTTAGFAFYGVALGTSSDGSHSHTITSSATSNGDHSHTVTVNSGGSGTTGASGTGATGADGTGATGSTGTGAAFSIVARSLGVNIQVLAY